MLRRGDLIFSDLDGTLLDHFSYRADDALPVLANLKQLGIPVILNTSKTLAELIPLRQSLSLDSPFVVENGAAIYLPKNQFSNQPKDTSSVEDFWVRSFSKPKSHWLSILSDKLSEYRANYIGFSQMTVQQLASLTGLNIENAAAAKQRQYGEPIHWLGNETKKRAFIEELKALGANVVSGGRFIHIGDDCNKGVAMVWISQLYQSHQLNNTQAIRTVALGDGENDIPMLELADIAIQIRSPVHPFPKLARRDCVMQTTAFGPAGWAEVMNSLISTHSSTSEVTHG